MQNRCLSPLSFVESFPLARSLHAWHDTHKQPLFLTTFLRAQTLFARSQRTGQRRDKRLSAFRFRSRRESLGLPTDMGGGVTRRAFPSQPEPFGAHDTVAAGAGGDGTNRAGVVRRYRVPFSHGLDGTCKLDSIPSPSEPPARCARRSMPLRECAGRRRSPSPATGAVAIAKTGQSVRWRAVAAARREKQTEQVTLCPPFDTPNSRRLCASEPFGDGPILWMGVAKAASRLGCRRLPSTTASRSLVPAVRSWRARWPYGTSIDASAEKFPAGRHQEKTEFETIWGRVRDSRHASGRDWERHLASPHQGDLDQAPRAWIPCSWLLAHSAPPGSRRGHGGTIHGCPWCLDGAPMEPQSASGTAAVQLARFATSWPDRAELA
ncbi:hypothetical protein ACCO45_005953 [Purpureocillium lilacinum]|uniref:Uncharacterized protein n=1 Tax=Purpureocillium lilacinum TaxID=33203 RepID=A0ACC4DZI3_PURLI